jgi:hypothetical protein
MPPLYMHAVCVCPSPNPTPFTIGQEKEKWHSGENQKKESGLDVVIKYLNRK